LTSLGNLLRVDKRLFTVEAALETYNETLEPQDIGPAAQFISDCLRFDAADRASAKELQLHNWLLDAFGC
jgi:serine/threonine-protein kinase SRPK3